MTTQTTETRRVFCIGETVLDIIFRKDQPVAAKPGGSMLNTAVSLGRAGVKVYLITDFASDHTGTIIEHFLKENGVLTTFTDRYEEGKTALALAFLDDRQDASYSFYKDYPEVRINIAFPETRPGDIVLFGSFFAVTEGVRDKLTGFIKKSHKNGAFIIYDPNFRKPHLRNLVLLKPWIMENIGMADLVRGSDEDFVHIFAVPDAKQAFQYVSHAGCNRLIYTKNSMGVEVITPKHAGSYVVPQIQPVSTIGAGDAFNAGVIYALLQLKNGPIDSHEPAWNDIIGRGIQFSANVCQSLENYISEEFGKMLKLPDDAL